MGLSVRKNLGGLTGKEENVQEEPIIFRTKPLQQKRTKKTTETKEEVAKRKHIEEELNKLTKRRKVEEVEEKKEEVVPKMVRLCMTNIRPKLQLVEANFVAPAIKQEVNFLQVKKEKVHIFGIASQLKQIETIILF